MPAPEAAVCSRASAAQQAGDNKIHRLESTGHVSEQAQALSAQGNSVVLHSTASQDTVPMERSRSSGRVETLTPTVLQLLLPTAVAAAAAAHLPPGPAATGP
jgi:hypothetical protein